MRVILITILEGLRNNLKKRKSFYRHSTHAEMHLLRRICSDAFAQTHLLRRICSDAFAQTHLLRRICSDAFAQTHLLRRICCYTFGEGCSKCPFWQTARVPGRSGQSRTGLSKRSWRCWVGPRQKRGRRYPFHHRPEAQKRWLLFARGFL
jgi:hypothetical protein